MSQRSKKRDKQGTSALRHPTTELTKPQATSDNPSSPQKAGLAGTEDGENDEENDSYRNSCVENSNSAIDEFDKAVLTLSGGALGVSFVFVKDIITLSKMVGGEWLLAAWSCWTLGIVSVLWSYYSSFLANRRAIKAADGLLPEGKESGFWNAVTWTLSPIGGLAFVGGVCCMVIFSYGNLQALGVNTSHGTNNSVQVPVTILAGISTNQSTNIPTGITATIAPPQANTGNALIAPGKKNTN